MLKLKLQHFGYLMQRADSFAKSLMLGKIEGNGETVETVSDFIFGGSKITADGDCSHEIIDRILKSRDIILPTKVCLVKAIVFLVVTYGCESWSIKKAEH